MEEKITQETVENFFNGKNLMQYITNIECGYQDDEVTIIFNKDDKRRLVKKVDFYPFCYPDSLEYLYEYREF